MVTQKKFRIPPYEAVGVVAAQSIGEPGTQMSLPAEEKVLVCVNDEMRYVKIGEFVDGLMVRLGAKETDLSEVRDIPAGMNVLVPSLGQDGKIKWKRLLQISRHRNRKKILKLKTRSGRSITATDNHSFVIRKDGEIIPVAGSKLKKGDRIPAIRNLPVPSASSGVSLSALLPKTQHWFDSELKKATLLEKNHKGGYGTCYQVPVAIEQLGNHLSGNSIEDGYVCPYMKHGKVRIPEQFELDDSFGWFVGAYLAAGNATRYYVSISNTDERYLSQARNFAKKLNLSFNEYDNYRGFSKGCDMHINSSVLSTILKKTCGSGCANKRIPAFAFTACGGFVGSLLRAYFDGDGNITVDRNAIRASSISEELIDGIALLLSRFGIFSTKHKRDNEYSLSISYRYAPIFRRYISSDTKKDALDALCNLSMASEKSYDSNDVVAGFGDILYDVAEKLGFPKRLINNFTKRQRIGRTALRRYIGQFEKLGKERKIDVGGELLRLRVFLDEDVVWDEIISVEYIEPPNGRVYDFSVEGLETFATFDGIITHNTMRTFHYAGVAEHVPTGLPRLIEIVDAKKEPKKPIIDVYLKSAYRSAAEAEKIARELSSVFISDIARVEDNLEELSVTVKYNEKDGKALGVTFNMLKNVVAVHCQAVKIGGDNVITVQPKKEKPVTTKSGEKKERVVTAKSVRRIANRIRDAIVKGVKGIHRAVVVKGENEYFIRAAGSNILGAISNQAVDPKRVYTNNLKEIEKVFGIEAARNAIVREIDLVLKMQKLFVDIRHIMLVADAMTYSGMLKSIGRHGLSGEKVGVLGRAAFEETVKHLINASAIAEEERLIGVTENIIVGQTVPVGTGRIRLAMNMKTKGKM